MRSTVARCATIALSLVAATLVVGTASTAHGATPTGLRVVGDGITRGGQPFLARGLSLVGTLAGAGCTHQETTAAAGHLGQQEMNALASGWHANTVRLQVSQTALSDPVTADVTTYLDAVAAAVSEAHQAGMAVILSMQDQALSCGPSHPLPSQETRTAWANLAPRFGADADVAFELFNEPHDGAAPAPGTLPGPGQWDEWLSGGTGPDPNLGTPAVGHQRLVDDIRATGATNVLIADGLNKAGVLQGVPLLHDTLATPNIVYAVHPYYYALGVDDWAYRFGTLARQVPVLATEWNYPTSVCGTTPQTLAPQFLSYLSSVGIGVLGQAADLGIGTLLMADWAWSPTTCGTVTAGPGVDFAAATAAAAAVRASAITLDVGSGFTVGASTNVNGVLTVAGTPAPGVTVGLSRRNPDGSVQTLTTSTTQGNGAFQVSDTPVAVGTTVYTATYAGNAATSAAAANASAAVSPIGTFLAASGPASAARGVALTISGALTAGDPVPAGRQVTWTRTDLTGTVALAPLSTADGGAFVATDTPPAGGTVTYTFQYAGDSRHAPSTTSVAVAVSRLTPALTVAVNGRVFSYGGAGTVTVHLGPTYTNRTVTLSEYVYGVPNPAWTVVHTGPVNSAGDYVLSTHFYRHVAFQATFGGDARYAPVSASTSTTSLARITVTVPGSYGTSGSYLLFHRSTDPAVQATLAPARGAVGCVTFTAQALTKGAWTTVATTACVPVGATSAATGHPLTTHTVSVQYRVRASIATDTVNAATTSGWVYLRFTT